MPTANVKRYSSHLEIGASLSALFFQNAAAVCSVTIRYEAELRIKKGWVEENFKRIGKLPISCRAILPSPQPDGYRNKAQIPCSTDAAGRPVFGFFAPHSHRIIPCEHCLLEPAFYSALIRRIAEWMEQYGIEPYHEQTHTGTVRHLFIRRDGKVSGEIMVCIVANADFLPHTDDLVDSLRKKIQTFPVFS